MTPERRGGRAHRGRGGAAPRKRAAGREPPAAAGPAAAEPPALDERIPRCVVARDGGNLRIVMRVEGLLAAGGRFEVVPVFGPVPPAPEERWQMTATEDGRDAHDMATAARHLAGDGINFQVNLCALSAQLPDGVLEVTVEQDGAPRPIAPPMRFPLDDVPVCQSAAAKLTPTVVVGGFAILLG